jgi:lactoylglutathione lyase
MPASLRLEIFPSNLERCLAFYIDTLQFTMRKRKDNYAFFARGNIFLAAIGVPTEETLEEKEAYRRPTKGLEIVFEVDDLEAERDRIVAHGFKLDADIAKQEWGLTDFRVVDPDGYCKCLFPRQLPWPGLLSTS